MSKRTQVRSWQKCDEACTGAQTNGPTVRWGWLGPVENGLSHGAFNCLVRVAVGMHRRTIKWSDRQIGWLRPVKKVILHGSYELIKLTGCSKPASFRASCSPVGR